MTEHPTAFAPPIEAPGQSGRINPELYINRELSWIAFNRRVLEEAQRPDLPLLEQVKFASIFHSNLDEFFMIRVSGVKEQIDNGVTRTTPDGLLPAQQLQAIRAALLPLLASCEQLVNNKLLPALDQAGIVIRKYAELSATQQEALHAYYERELYPVLTPLAVDPSHRFPFISNLSLNLAIELDGPHGEERFARVKVPEMLPRLVPVPVDAAARQGAEQFCFVWLEDLIAANLGTLFHGRAIRAISPFRITRDVDLEIQEDEADDLLETMEENVRQRRFGQVVRLEVAAQASADLQAILAQNLAVDAEDVYLVAGPLGLKSLMELYGVARPELKDPPFTAATPAVVHHKCGEELFAAIRQQDIVLHHPFEAFSTVIELLETAARDPQVLAIKQTLYRVGRNSPVVHALMQAREEGKQVAALVELKARFDEENNIGWAKALESTGAHVVYGLPGLKVHAKLLLIVRREDDGIRRYVHLATGNYNASTARLYTDLGLLTCNEAIGADVSALFNVLTGAGEHPPYRNLLVAPHTLHQGLLDRIAREIARHEAVGDGRIIFKCNGLTDEPMIMALYRAAQAGVQIDLIVRGICGIRPAIPGLSESLRVRSIVGRFLEHHRLYYFHNGGAEELYLGSADLMERNLHRRIEQLVRVEDPQWLRHLRDNLLEVYLRDNLQARELQADGTYRRLTPGQDEPVDSQARLLKAATKGGTILP